MNKSALYIVRFYQLTLSHFLGGHCRFYPSCSHYAVECYEKLPFLEATSKTLIRILKCFPFSKYSGYDPVVVKTKGNYNEQSTK